jgi:hypothetical protein
MNSRRDPSPGPIPNHLLCEDRKLDPSKRYRKDFGVVSPSIDDKLSSFFKGGPKIVRPYVLIPGTDQFDFLLEPFVVTVRFGDQNLRKTVDGHWTLGMIRAQLCQSLDLSHRKTHFVHPDSEEVLPDSADVSEFPIVSLQIDYLRDDASRFQSCTRSSVPVLVGIPPHLSVSLYCFARISPLAGLLLSDDLHIKPGFKSPIVAPLRTVIEQLDKRARATIEGREFMLALENFTFEARGVARSK